MRSGRGSQVVSKIGLKDDSYVFTGNKVRSSPAFAVLAFSAMGPT